MPSEHRTQPASRSIAESKTAVGPANEPVESQQAAPAGGVPAPRLRPSRAVTAAAPKARRNGRRETDSTPSAASVAMRLRVYLEVPPPRRPGWNDTVAVG